MKFKINAAIPISFLFLCWTHSVSGQVRLPRLISDGMVLQRESEVKIWGWSAPGERISIRFLESTFLTSANGSGEWEVILGELESGGPHKMSIRASNEIEIQDIMIGDVWLCSGQSNMELWMGRVSWVYPDEIAACGNNLIRQFLVPDTWDFTGPHEDLPSGSWKTANPQNIMDFSAVAYFFTKELQAKYGIPVGLINAALGGSPAEAWMSEDALKKFPDHYKEMQRYKDTAWIKRLIRDDRARAGDWYDRLYQKDEGYKDKHKPWYQSSLKSSGWKTMCVPGYWTGTELEKTNGSIWFGRTFEINAEAAGKPGMLILGRIIDADSVYLNGKFIGSTGYQYPPRRYRIPQGVLKEGENTVIVRVISNLGTGGFVPDKPYEIICGSDTTDLKGPWQYRIGTIMEPLDPETFIRWKPGGLYNAMLAPLMDYRIKGAAWYQGEANTGRAIEYREVLPALIGDWRRNWQQGDFPFIFVQLHNFMEPRDNPSESNWALLRESQMKALSVPNTGMAVAIDLGEWNDIHPLNKKEVGYRLALAAQHLAYGDNKVVYSGPVYDSMRIEGNRIILSFSNIGGGLVSRGGGELKEFCIAGNDRQFEWAHAEIQDDKVVVWNDKIAHPVAVRYAWADNPAKANLFNREGLPASPFRTDEWIPDNLLPAH